ncbi:thiamine pyrophosphate-dependent enzyme [Lentzea nigeriaca]|uniref:thiamine pyrophosphate-dependent enzyme n=1 Tax=Lentzea nigeriaca TaxID=1128665 RepID=UPI001EF918A4|nr:thiamine pyrophosphate-dependent enzyme [Lentzea nigeriaca]MBM7859853.1 transketolase [Lentzea nigeriaca]
MQRIPELFARMTGDEKHEWAAASTIDVLWVLYDRVLDVTPATVDDPDRDRFLLSKGHGPMAYYAVLAEKGFISESTLDDWTSWDSPLGLHPDRALVNGVEISSGSLGHGLPIAVGTALGQRIAGSAGRTFVLVGDGELDEGSNHEAIAVAARLNVANLTAIVIDNQNSMYGWPGGIAGRFAVEGWQTAEVDGRDHEAIFTALTAPHDRPYAVVAKIEKSY